MVHTILQYMPIRITEILLSCPAYYIHFIFNLCGSYPGKKAKIFEYAKGLPTDVAKSYSMGDRISTYENEMPINN